LVLLASFSARAEPVKPPVRLLVYTLSSPERWAPLAKDLSEGIVAHVAGPAARKGITALSESDVALMGTFIAERADLSEEDCRKAERCLARLSQAADANKTLYGWVDRVGDSYVAVLTLLDAVTGEREGTKSVISGSEGEFRTLLLETADEILGLSTSSPEGGFSPEPLPAHGQKVAVVPFTGLEGEPGIAETLTNLFSVELLKYEYSVLTRSELIVLLRDAMERRSLLNESRPLDEIIVPLAGAYGADYLATGHVAKFDRSYIIVLKLILISEASVIRRYVEVYRGGVDYLPAALKFAAARLFGREMPGAGDLSILTDVEGEYRIDRGRPGALPQATPHVGLAATKHELSISAPGYLPYSADLYIDGESAEPLKYRPALEPLAAEWYESPIVWGIIGVAVAGATTAILLATVPPNGADSSFQGERE
ncbi:MAG TPA: hypothetical protein VD788_08760, partial [Candidatus Polarisedimenticolaceae bacterium]|nr:hypothetical protein [Candidatus Polarisedimenticolaceae bacterium]